VYPDAEFPGIPDHEKALCAGSHVKRGVGSTCCASMAPVPDKIKLKIPLEFVFADKPSEFTVTESMAAFEIESTTVPFMVSPTAPCTANAARKMNVPIAKIFGNEPLKLFLVFVNFNFFLTSPRLPGPFHGSRHSPIERGLSATLSLPFSPREKG